MDRIESILLCVFPLTTDERNPPHNMVNIGIALGSGVGSSFPPVPITSVGFRLIRSL